MSDRPLPAPSFVKTSVRALPPVSMLLATIRTFGFRSMYSSYRASYPKVPKVVMVSSICSPLPPGSFGPVAVSVAQPLATRASTAVPAAMLAADVARDSLTGVTPLCVVGGNESALIPKL